MSARHGNGVHETGTIPIVWTPFPPVQQTRPLDLKTLQNAHAESSSSKSPVLYHKKSLKCLSVPPSTPPKDPKYNFDRRGSECSTLSTHTTDSERTLVSSVQDIQLLPGSPPLKPLSVAQKHARWQQSLDYHELLCSISLDKASSTTSSRRPTGRRSHGNLVQRDQLPPSKTARKSPSQTSIKSTTHISDCLLIPPTRIYSSSASSTSSPRKPTTALPCSTCTSNSKPHNSTCKHGSSRTAEEEFHRLHCGETTTTITTRGNSKSSSSDSDSRDHPQGSYFDHGGSKNESFFLKNIIAKRFAEFKERKAAESRLRKINKSTSMDMEERGFEQNIYSYWRA